VVDDQRLNPTYTPHLAAAAAAAVAEGLAGVVHLAAAGCCSWREFAVEALRAAGVEAPIEAVTTAELPAAAARPLNGCLESERRPPLPDWRQGLAEWAVSLS
jgi:dTDP-4-dehydrorhamnose reductase